MEMGLGSLGPWLQHPLVLPLASGHFGWGRAQLLPLRGSPSTSASGKGKNLGDPPWTYN